MELKRDSGNIKIVLNPVKNNLSVNTSEGIVYISIFPDVFIFEKNNNIEKVSILELNNIYDYCYNNKYQCNSVIIGNIKNIPRNFIKYLKDNYANIK